jgi:hypothetical protein
MVGLRQWGAAVLPFPDWELPSKAETEGHPWWLSFLEYHTEKGDVEAKMSAVIGGSQASSSTDLKARRHIATIT